MPFASDKRQFINGKKSFAIGSIYMFVIDFAG